MQVSELIEKKLEESRNILVIISRPIDNDCLGCGIVLKRQLKRKGKDVRLVSPSKIPEQFDVLPYMSEIEVKDTKKMDLLKFDLIISVDGGNTKQFAEVSKDSDFNFNGNKEVLNIDHHMGNTHFAKYEIWDKEASSTGEVLLLSILAVDDLNKNEATLLYGALVGDTGNFRYNFNVNTFKLATELIAKGANSKLIINNYFYDNSDIGFKILAELIEETFYINKLGYTYVIADYDKLTEEYDCDFGKVKEGIRLYENYFSRAVKNIQISFVLKKHGKNLTVAIKGNTLYNKVPLPEIGKSLGCESGGHFNSSGFYIDGAVDNVIVDINRVMKNLYKEYKQK